jgi:hypothetical protein
MIPELFARARRWAWLSVPVALVACALTGCGATGPVGKVAGHVTLSGAPVPQGTVVMFTDGPDPFSGTTGADGKFTVDRSVKAGTYAVAVQQVEKVLSYEESKKAGANAIASTPQSVIPEKYRTAGTSGVKFEVKAGEANKFELDMLPGAAIPSGGGPPMKGGQGGG